MHPVIGQWYFNKQLWVLPTYTVFLIAAIASGYFFALIQATSFKVSPKEIERIFFLIIPFGFLGAKILALGIENNPHPTLENSGLTFYGGALFGILAVFLYAKFRKINFLSLLDTVTWSSLLGIAVGRVGCFMAGCCYGKATTSFLGILYTDPRSLAFDPILRRQPTQLLEALSTFSLFLLLFKFKEKKKSSGFFSAVAIGGYSFCRFGIEFLRGDEYRGMLNYLPISFAQVISLALLGIVIISTSLTSRHWGKQNGSYSHE